MRIPLLYLAPWVDLGGSDQGTIDWFRHIDRTRFAPSLITTQPSANRRLHHVEPYAEEVWHLPDHMAGPEFPRFILGFVQTRRIRVAHLRNSRLAFDLLLDMAALPEPPAIVVQLDEQEPKGRGYLPYVATRYDALVDRYSVVSRPLAAALASYDVAPSRIEVIPGGVDAAERFDPARTEREMTARHERLYLDVLARGHPTPADPPPASSPPAELLRLLRSPVPERTVGVIVPCYRHGLFVEECIESVRRQTLPPAQVVLVDDGSDDPETLEALDRIEAAGDVPVVRLPENRGPSVARNRGLQELDTAYVLPLDADDKLLPDALERMVAQLERCPDDVGFVYPHRQHFGNRHDCLVSPSYNLYRLLQSNYAPATALFDRRVFSDGLAYSDEVPGHEDWDLLLQLAERGVRGVPADRPTFLYRKRGFSRVDAGQYGAVAIHSDVRRRHPALFSAEERIKAQWAPALSIVLLDGGEQAVAPATDGLADQSCGDFEILAAAGVEVPEDVRCVRVGGTGAGRLAAALAAASGRWVLAATPALAAAWTRRTFVEALLRSLWPGGARAVALASAPGPAGATFSVVPAGALAAAEPRGVAWDRGPDAPSPEADLGTGATLLDDLVAAFEVTGPIEWRRVAGP